MDTFGYMAAFLTTVAFVPQTVKVIKSEDTKSLSLMMYIMFCFGVLCFVLYGILSRDMPILWANLITLSLAAFVLRLKIKNG